MKKRFTCFWSTIRYWMVAVMPFSVCVRPMGWTNSLSTAAERLGDQATALASCRSNGTFPQAAAKGGNRFTSSTKTVKQAARLPTGMPSNRRRCREAVSRFTARSTVVFSAGGTDSSSANSA